MGFLNSPKVIYVYFTRLVVATAISINCLNLKKKRKLYYASIKLKFSKESASGRERRAAKLRGKRGRQLPRLPRSITRVFTFMSRAFHSSD